MDCERCTQLLSARLDEPLSRDEEEWLKTHLAACPECRALAEELEELKAGFGELEDVSAPEGFAQGVMDRIRSEKKVVPLFRRRHVRVLAGAAACLVLCAALYGMEAGQLSSPVAPSADITLSSVKGSAEPRQAEEELLTEPAGVQTYRNENKNESESEGASEGESEGSAIGEPSSDRFADGQTAQSSGGGAAAQEPVSSNPGSGQPKVGTQLFANPAGAGTEDTVLTLSRLPEGAAELIGPDTPVSSLEAGSGTAYASLTLEQLEQIESLALEQGIAAVWTSEEGQGLYTLVVTGE